MQNGSVVISIDEYDGLRNRIKQLELLADNKKPYRISTYTGMNYGSVDYHFIEGEEITGVVKAIVGGCQKELSDRWETVSNLQDENRGLRQHIGQLESTIKSFERVGGVVEVGGKKKHSWFNSPQE